MSEAKWLASTVPIRVGKDTRAELREIQRQVWDEHRARISVDEVIKRLLADRKQTQP